MRKIYFAILFTVILTFLTVPVKAQVHFNVNLNIGSQPVWGPVGYDEVEYYYLPDIESYYYVPQHVFYFNEGGRWVSHSSMPARYRSYDIYNSYKVVVNEREPWHNHKIYRDKYASFKGRHDQQIIRDSRDTKYFVNKNHPEHKKWIVEQKKHDNGNGNKSNGNNKGNGNNGHGKGNKKK